MLEAVAPNVIVDKAIINDISEGQRALSPGMKYKHYSPKEQLPPSIIAGIFPFISFNTCSAVVGLG